MVYFQTKNPNLGKFLEGLRMENVGIFYGRMEYLRPLGIFYGNLVVLWSIFSPFGILCQEKSGNPGRRREGALTHFCLTRVSMLKISFQNF
jgi:hypothetical protein